MKLQTLVITTNKTRDSVLPLLDKLNIQSDVIVANQTKFDSNVKFKYKEHDVLFYCYSEKGVSKNRNMAASLCDADIMLFSDDDTPLVDNYPHIVLSSFEKNADAEAFIFSRTSHDPQFDSHIFKDKKVKRFSEIGTLGGSGLALKKETWLKHKLSFNEKLGAPNYLCLGEDSLFGKEMLDKGVNVWTSSVVLFDVPKNNKNSSYFNNYDERYFISMGACVYLIHPRAWRIYAWYKAFVWKKRIGKSVGETHKLIIKGVRQGRLLK